MPTARTRGRLAARPRHTFCLGLKGILYAVYARGPNQGKLRWQYPPAVAPSPADACGTTTAPLVISSVPSGNPSGPGIASSAAVSDDVAGHTAVIFGAPDPNSNGGDGRLWALDARTGQCIWKSAVIAPTSGTSKIGYSSPAIAHGRAYVGVSARYPDDPITVGQLFAVKLSDGSFDPAFPFSASGPPAGGGIWSSPAITPGGNIILTTGNSCVHSIPNCTSSIPTTDYTMSMVKLDWHNKNVLWQLQPVDIHYDNDPLPFQQDGHGDTRFIRPGAVDRDHVYITSGGYNLTEIAPGNPSGNVPGRIVLNRLYSLDACASDDDRIRWIFDLNGNAAGAPSVAHGLIYVGADTEFDTSATPHEFYVLADTDVLSASGSVCSYPLGPAGSGFPPGPACTGAGFKPVPVPQTIVHFPLTGAMPVHPAIAEGRVLLAGCATIESDEELAPPEPARHAQKLRPPLEYQAVEGTQGALRQATLYSQKVPSLAATLEVRSILLLPRESVFPTDRETLLEVLTGDALTVNGNERKAHPTGDIWLVGKGSRVTLKAKGEITVLRAISLAPKPSR